MGLTMLNDSFYRGKKVLVTGHTGFKGAWLSIWLQSMGAEVFGFALDPISENCVFSTSRIGDLITDVRGDVRNFQQLKDLFLAYNPEIVFHLAAQPLVLESYRNPLSTIEVNVQGSCNVLEAARYCSSVRSVVMVTTDKCYENREWIWGYRETDAMGGHDPYSASKGAAELIISSYYRSFFKEKSQTGVASVRAGNVIGGGDWCDNRIVPDIFRAIIHDTTVKVRNPQSIRPWQHVLEPIGAYLLIAQRMWENPHDISGAWNIGPFSSHHKSVKDLVDEIIKSCGRGQWESEFSHQNAHEANLLSLDITKAQRLLGWSPVLSFHETVELTCNWYLAEPNTDFLRLALDQIKHYSTKWSFQPGN